MITTLFFHLGKRDDLVALSPFVAALLTIEPELRPVFVTTPESASFLQAPPPLSELRVYDPSWAWVKKKSFIQNLRRLNPIYSFSLSPDLSSHLLSYFTGAGIRGAILKQDNIWMRLFGAYLFHQWVLIANPCAPQKNSPSADFLNLGRKMGFPL